MVIISVDRRKRGRECSGETDTIIVFLRPEIELGVLVVVDMHRLHRSILCTIATISR